MDYSSPRLPTGCFTGALLSFIPEINMHDIGWVALWEFPLFSQRLAEH